MAPAFPRNVVLQSKFNQKYLALAGDNEDESDVSIEAKGDDVRSPLSKFNLEKSKTRKGLFHIRCCYSNKYVVMEAEGSSSIVAGAAKPNEDSSQWSSTLVELVPDKDDLKSVQFRLAYNRKFLSVKGANPPMWYTSLLYAVGDGEGLETQKQFAVINWDSLLTLPKYVAIKADNGFYLRSHQGDGTFDESQCLGDNIANPGVAHEIIHRGDGTIRIKPMLTNNSKEVFLGPSEFKGLGMRIISSPSPKEFTPVKAAGSNSIGLRCEDNQLFCNRFGRSYEQNMLFPDSPSIIPTATFIVEEAILSRDIFDVEFRLMHGRIYDQTVVTMITRDATNLSTTAETMDLKLVYTDTSTRTWERSLGLKLGYSATMTLGVPSIAEGSITISAEFEGSYKWGDTHESSTQIETTHTVTVPPRTRVKARLLATRGKCDVPFSYTQRDVLVDGRDVINTFDDGIYTGVNTYDFKFETTEEKLV